MKHGFPRKVISQLVASAGILGFSAAALAQQGNLVLDEVIVTATKQEESLNDVGLSVVAMGSRQIEEMGFRNMESLVKTIPNVDVTESLNGTRLTVRGVGSSSAGGVSPSVATFIDGVYLSSSRSSNAILYDMERVEVLRGPQGALFGKNAIAGVFSLLTARPTKDFEALVDVRAGNYDSHEGTVVVSGGLTDSLSARFAAFNRRTGDWLENDLGGPDAGGIDQEAYRLSMNWDISDNTRIWVKYEHNNDTLNASLNQMIGLDAGDRAVLASVNPGWLPILDNDMKLDRHMVSASFTRFGYDLGIDSEKYNKNSRDFGAVSIEHDFDSGYELSILFGADRTDATAHGNASASYPLSNIYLDTETEFRSKSVEIKLESPQDQSLRFTVGAYAEKSKEGIMDGYSYVNFDNLGPFINFLLVDNGAPPALLQTDFAALTPALMMRSEPGDNTTEILSLGLFAQGTYDINDEWAVTAGVRLAEDTLDQFFNPANRADWRGLPFASEASFLAAGVNPLIAAGYAATAQGLFGSFSAFGDDPVYKEEHTDRAVLPSLRVEYRPNVDMLYYFSAQSGYKNGGFNTFSLGNPTPFDKEKSLAMELGAKIALADGRGQLNAAIFNTEFEDLQVASIDALSGGVNFDNAAKAVSRGVELDFSWRLTEQLTFGAQYGYLDAKYKSYDNASCTVQELVAIQDIQPPLACPQDLGGEPLNNAPTNSGSVSLEFRQPLFGSLEFQSGLSVSYRDDYYTEASNSPEFEAPSATLVDLRLALANAGQQWTVALIGKNLTDDDGLIYGSGSGAGMRKGTYFGQMRQPRTYWVQFEKRFN